MGQQERSIRTRRLIVEAAGAVFAEHGFDGATISDVYTRVGLTKGAFYYYFASKEELAAVVLDSQMAEVRYPIIPRPTKLQELVDSGMVFVHRLRHDPMLQGSIRLSLEQGAHGLDQRKPFVGWFEHNRRGLMDAQRNGELHPHVDLDDVAEMFVGSFSGIQLVSQVMTGRADVERRISVLLQHLLPTIALPGPLAKLDMTESRGAQVLKEAAELGLTVS
ncbi:ScbR family autoregulator-binding transcription factor [Streptomyces beijiangensis]|uniref:TetR/AcrR family transcriptional regulator n=1 Tax=Streptomyces beijiangensis TaxID=163361 RepID=A0A939FD71_9ACTN|nr:ScbR family autoregulator-binding transcription factor [Streptomyces beijiangensis]MBO0516478.1 TetR/AcrR family transcriptional regulator [Streptomyces beijiangensis]